MWGIARRFLLPLVPVNREPDESGEACNTRRESITLRLYNLLVLSYKTGSAVNYDWLANDLDSLRRSLIFFTLSVA